MSRALARAAVGAVSVLLASGCGGGDGGPAAPTGGQGCRPAEGGTVTLVAVDLAWDADCLEAPAGQPVTIVVDNRDEGVNHNVHLRDAPGKPKTPLEAGPVTQRLEVDLPAGAYEYICDIHPNMLGTLRVTAAQG